MGEGLPPQCLGWWTMTSVPLSLIAWTRFSDHCPGPCCLFPSSAWCSCLIPWLCSVLWMHLLSILGNCCVFAEADVLQNITSYSLLLCLCLSWADPAGPWCLHIPYFVVTDPSLSACMCLYMSVRERENEWERERICEWEGERKEKQNICVKGERDRGRKRVCVIENKI